MLLSVAAPGAATCFLALSPSSVSVDHLAHFSPAAIKGTARLAFACEAVLGGLTDAQPDYNNRFLLGFERFKGPGFFSGAPAAEIAPVLLAGTLSRIVRTLTTSSFHCIIQHAIIIAAGGAFFEKYFRSDPTLIDAQPSSLLSRSTQLLSGAAEAAWGGMCVSLLYEYSLAMQGVLEGVLVDYTRGDRMLWSRIKHACFVPPLAAMWDGVWAGVGYFLGLGAGTGLIIARDLYNHPRAILPHKPPGASERID